MSKIRQYRFLDSDVYFRVGILADKRQVMMGYQHPEIVAVFFDQEGNLLEFATRAFTYEVFDRRFDDETRKWQIELGWTAKPICVKQFEIGERHIGIKEFPQHFQDYLDNPSTYDEEARSSHDSAIADWQEEKQFVLQWDEEYELDQNGNVVST